MKLANIILIFLLIAITPVFSATNRMWAVVVPEGTDPNIFFSDGESSVLTSNTTVTITNGTPSADIQNKGN